MAAFYEEWQKNFHSNQEILKKAFSQEELDWISSYLDEIQDKQEMIPVSAWLIARDIESYSDEEISFSEEQERILYAYVLSSSITGKEIVPDSFSFSPDEAEGRKRLEISREIALNPMRLLEILIPSISDSITALEDEEPERAEAIRAYAKRLFKACIG